MNPFTAIALVALSQKPVALSQKPVALSQKPVALAQEPAASRPAPLLGLHPDPAREPIPVARFPQRVAGRVCIVTYAGFPGARPDLARTKAEARTLAGAISVAARSQGGSLEALARRWSDDAATRERGGNLGTIRPRRDLGPVERELFGVAIGSVIGPIETPSGIAVAQRVPVEELAYERIVVRWVGAGRFPGLGAQAASAPIVERSREEARARAGELVIRAAAEPSKFADLVRTESDDPILGATGGFVAPAPRGEIAPLLEDALLAIRSGDVTGPIETPYGLLIIRRCEIEWRTADLLLVQYRGAVGAPITQLRTREEARARAEAMLAEVRKPGSDFGALAEAQSDDPDDRPWKGSRTMAVSEGSPPWLREAAHLAVGETAIFESPFGFHVVRRVATQTE